MTIPPADATLVAIRKKVRRLTASASESTLSTTDIDQYINTYYSQDFPYGIKIDQMRSVYTFFTEPYRDRYPLDVNYNQGVRAPMYVEGIQGSFMKDRQQFFNVWPRFPTKFHPPASLTMGSITGATQANPTQITSVNHGLNSNDPIYINDILGMVELNNRIFTITVTGVNTFTLNGIDSTAYTPYISGGSWTLLTLSFTIPGPFLSKEVVFGGVSIGGTPISINDDGNGNLIFLTPNPIITSPAYTSVYVQNANPPLLPADIIGKPIPGMHNQNTLNPGLNTQVIIGTVNYVTGVFAIDFSIVSVVPDTAIQFTLWVSQYQTGRPYSLLFWNNEFTVRPVPKDIHKIEIETYLTPVQFLAANDVPILNQWWQLIAIGAAIKVLEDRQDMEGIQNLGILYDRQEDLVLERQGVEELFQPNIQLFNSTISVYGGINGVGYY